MTLAAVSAGQQISHNDLDQIINLLTGVMLDQPVKLANVPLTRMLAAPTVTPTGTGGATTYGYQIVAVNASGDAVPSPTGQTTTGNAALSGTNYNALSWAAQPGAASYKVIRTAGGATQGLIASGITGTTYNDQGAAAGAYSAATSDPQGGVSVVALAASGMTGAAAASRYVGATASGAPASGTFLKGDFVIDQTGAIWICTAAGSPGTWQSSAGLTVANTWTQINTFPAVAISGLTGSVAASRYVGATASGAPTSGAHVVGDFIVDQTGSFWICTAAGTPGTWKQAGAVDTTAADIKALAAAAAAGALSLPAAADHVHPWTGLGVLANAQTWAALNTFSAGMALTGGALALNGLVLNLTGATSGAYIQDDGTYLSFQAHTARNFYIQTSIPITYIYSPTIYLGDGTNAANTVSLRNASLTKSYNASDSVPTLPSATGARIWIQGTDPGGSANNGDIWVGG